MKKIYEVPSFEVFSVLPEQYCTGTTSDKDPLHIDKNTLGNSLGSGNDIWDD